MGQILSFLLSAAGTKTSAYFLLLVGSTNIQDTVFGFLVPLVLVGANYSKLNSFGEITYFFLLGATISIHGGKFDWVDGVVNFT